MVMSVVYLVRQRFLVYHPHFFSNLKKTILIQFSTKTARKNVFINNSVSVCSVSISTIRYINTTFQYMYKFNIHNYYPSILKYYVFCVFFYFCKKKLNKLYYQLFYICTIKITLTESVL